MLHHFKRHVIGLPLLLAIGLAAAGCSKLAVNNSSLDYRETTALPPLQLANGQVTRPFVALYPVPELPAQAPKNAPLFSNEKGNRFMMPAPIALDTTVLQARANLDIGKPSAPTMVTDGNGFPILRTDGSTERVWDALLQSLSAANVNVTKNTRSTGQIELRLEEQSYTLRLGRSGSATTVSLQDRQNTLADAALATSLMQKIIQHWPI